MLYTMLKRVGSPPAAVSREPINESPSSDAADGSLERVLSRWQLFAIGFGAIVGWGWSIQMGY
jgi:hypothetical protein